MQGCRCILTLTPATTTTSAPTAASPWRPAGMVFSSTRPPHSEERLTSSSSLLFTRTIHAKPPIIPSSSYTATKIPFIFWELRRLQTKFPHSCVCERFIYSQDLSTYFLQQNRQINRGIYKSLTDTWMWKSGLWPHNSFSENICLKFSVLVLCSLGWVRPETSVGSSIKLIQLLKKFIRLFCWYRNLSSSEIPLALFQSSFT